MGSIDVRRLGVDDVGLIASIDRSEHVDVEYDVVDGALQERPVTMADIPAWDAERVAHQIEVCSGHLRRGAVMLGAFEEDRVLGIAVIDPVFEPPMAWLAFLHVSAPARRRGVATTLWSASADLARASGATTMYVSAIPTGSALGFYLRQGCHLAETPHPDLYAKEPDDVHLICPLR